MRPYPHEKAVVRRAELPPGRRILALSDIHGNLEFLKGALNAAQFSAEDILFVVGDILEKGKQSLETLRYLMELSKTRTVYPLRGNCDQITLAFMARRGWDDETVWRVMHSHWWKDTGFFWQLANEAGLVLNGPEDFDTLRAVMARDYSAELNFLRSMPTVIETQHYIFVHGGIPREDRLEELDNHSLLKNDNFMGQGLRFKKWVIVGHWPVTLYRTDIAQADPVVERDRHIISIDGGCVLKADGQLNVLIIPERGSEDFSWVSYDGFPTATALDDQEPSEDPVNIRWSERRVEVLRREEEFSLCRHIATGRELRVLTDYLYETPDGTVCEDSTDYRLPVKAGDILRVVRRVKGGALVKKDGVTGWYWGRLGTPAPDNGNPPPPPAAPPFSRGALTPQTP